MRKTHGSHEPHPKNAYSLCSLRTFSFFVWGFVIGTGGDFWLPLTMADFAKCKSEMLSKEGSYAPSLRLGSLINSPHLLQAGTHFHSCGIALVVETTEEQGRSLSGNLTTSNVATRAVRMDHHYSPSKGVVC